MVPADGRGIGMIVGFFRLLRPQFLLASIVLFLIGAEHASHGALDLMTPVLIAIASAFLVQVSGHLANDYFDADGDDFSRRTLFSGGSGTIQAGIFSRSFVLGAAVIMTLAAVLLSILASYDPSRPLFAPMIAIGLIGAWAYSAPPLRLASTGVGELSVAILIGLLLPVTGFYFIAGDLDLSIAPLLLPLFLFSFQSLIGVEMPDHESDMASGKRDLVVRLGIRQTAKLQTSVLGLAYLAVAAECAFGMVNNEALAALVTAPIAVWSSYRLLTMKGYDFGIAGTASTVGMAVNGITMLVLLVQIALWT